MNLLKKLLGSSNTSKQSRVSREEHEQRIRQNTDHLWKFIEEVLAGFNMQSCQCAFPRFRQIAGINCVDYGKSFYCSETEGLIHHARTYFTITKLETGHEAYNEIWCCKKCGSLYDYGWSDFSIHVDRSFLKIKELKTTDIGAEAQLPVPLFVGIFGHSFPGKEELVPVDFDTFRKYISAVHTRMGRYYPIS